MNNMKISFNVKVTEPPDKMGEIPVVLLQVIHDADKKVDEYVLPISVANDLAYRLEMGVQNILITLASQLPVKISDSKQGRH